MNLIEFSKIMKDPGQLNGGHLDSLEKIIEEFPYFQVARALYLNALKKQNSFKYNTELKKTAAYTTDRSILFDFITSDSFVLENYISKDHKTKEPEATEAAGTTEERTKESETPAESKPAVRPVENQISGENRSEKSKAKDTPDLPKGKPIPFKKSDSFSFNEWLNLTQLKPIERPEQEENAEEDLIDRFIRTGKRIKPGATGDTTDYARSGSEVGEHLMTETLAHVYLEQKKYDKAIAAFRILSLKYPKKSSFFAHQIKEIEKLKHNT